MSNIHIMNNDLKRKYSAWNPFKSEIEAILACAEYGNITKAAERVGLSQASLSKILVKVEDGLGSKIFIRSPRGIQITQIGKEFILSLRNIRSHWGQYAVEAGHVENFGLGEISIGTHTSIANAVFPRILETLLIEFPQTKFSFEFKRSVEVTQKVARSELDIGFVVNPIKNPDLVAKPFAEGYIGLWGKGKVASDSILYSTDMFLSEKILKTVRNKRLVEINDYETIANIIENSHLSGLLPSSVANRFGFQPQSGKLFSVDLSVIYRKDRFYSKNQKQFVSRVLELLSNE
jgi:DNA-binding transcriptional LysR family regulator